MCDIRVKLLASIDEGSFLETVYQVYLKNREDRTAVSNELALLHNRGSINVIDEFIMLTQEAVGHKFFTIRQVFEDTLPEINAPLLDVMKCVKHLNGQAGNDLTVGTLNSPFIKYCQADSDRSNEVLEYATNIENNLFDFIPLAIVAGLNSELERNVNAAIKLTNHINKEVRIQAAFALGRIDFQDNLHLLKKALNTLKRNIQTEYDDRLFGITLKSAFNLYLADNTLEEDVAELIQAASSNKEDYALHSVSELFGFHTKEIPVSILNVIVLSLQEVNISNIGTLDNIDFGLQHLIKNNQEDKAVVLLEQLLIKHQGFSIQIFNSLTHTLYSDNPPFLNKLVTRWLLSKKTSLGKAVMDIIKTGHGSNIYLSVDTGQLDIKSKEDCLFITRKVIGWLFTNPVSATSFIVSLIDSVSEAENDHITDLLFNPLLISYSGEVRKYIEKLMPNPSHKVQSVLTNALSKLSNYHEDLKDSREISELLPPQVHRETYSRLFNRQMAESMKIAQKDSIFSLIASKSVLLYGRKSINYIHGPDEKVTRQVMPLQEYGHSIEFPRLELMDPEGLDYMLRVFRTEGCQS